MKKHVNFLFVKLYIFVNYKSLWYKFQLFIKINTQKLNFKIFFKYSFIRSLSMYIEQT